MEHSIQIAAGGLPAWKNHWEPEPGVFVGSIKVSTAWQGLSIILKGDNAFGNSWALRHNDDKGRLGDNFLCVPSTDKLKAEHWFPVSLWPELLGGVNEQQCGDSVIEFYYLENRNMAHFRSSDIYGILSFFPSPP